MKSVMEEASSIMKAVEQGWNNAGKPKEFTVKIFEEPEKNFIGMTTRSAKVGIFFTDQVKKPIEAKPKREPVKKTIEVIKKEVEPQAKKPATQIWTDDMVNSAKEWLSQMLQFMDHDVPFSIKPEHFHLKIQFDKGIFDDKKREKHLFASLSTLLITMLKRQYKRPLKGYKVVIIGG